MKHLGRFFICFINIIFSFFKKKNNVKMASAAANPAHYNSREPRLLQIWWRGGGLRGVGKWVGRKRLDYVERAASNDTRAPKALLGREGSGSREMTVRPAAPAAARPAALPAGLKITRIPALGTRTIRAIARMSRGNMIRRSLARDTVTK